MQVPIATPKVEGPPTELGILIDTVSGGRKLPPLRLRQLFRLWRGCKKRELLSLMAISAMLVVLFVQVAHFFVDWEIA